MARSGGFPVKIFCNEAKYEPYRCLVCCNVCRAPVTCQSGAHLFCHDCLTESLRQNPSCPVDACKQEEPLTIPVPSAFVAAKVSDLDIVCVHDKCKWRGTCGRLDGHLESDCPYEPIACSGDGGCGALVPRGDLVTHEQFYCFQSCPNSVPKAFRDAQDVCEVRMSRSNLNDHVKNDCKLRLISCPHPPCEATVQYNKMSAHLEICPYAPVSCPRSCGAGDIRRQSLEAHRKDCPNEPVACGYAPSGCSHVASRCEIAQHEKDTSLHFSILLSKAFAEQQEAYQQKMEKMEQTFSQSLQQLDQAMERQIALLMTLEKQSVATRNALSKKLTEQSAKLRKKMDQPTTLHIRELVIQVIIMMVMIVFVIVIEAIRGTY